MRTSSIESPVFILGCGRSGTTILGNLLAQHPSVTYRHEHRPLWTSAYPETDIWSERAITRRGKLAFTESDVNPRKTRALRKLFALELQKSRRPILVEKLPINNFRLPFIRGMFPDCRFIHIWRNGLEVARSIETMSLRGRWFKPDQYRWNMLAEYAQSMPETAPVPALCQSYYEKGLLEWRVSTADGYVIPWAPATRQLARGVLLRICGGPTRDKRAAYRLSSSHSRTDGA
jgi:Sulfotransferase family